MIHNKQQDKREKNSGFTLIETLVAITILTVAVAAPLTLAAQSLIVAYSAKEQVVAFQLAQEAIETVRAQRDHNLLVILKTSIGEPTQNAWLADIPINKPFTVDSFAGTFSNSKPFTLCSVPSDPISSCTKLKYKKDPGSSIAYYNQTQGDETRFRRFVTVTDIPGTTDEVHVKAEVHWKMSHFKTTNKVIVETTLYNWINGAITEPENNASTTEPVLEL